MKILAINSSHRGTKGFTHYLIGRVFKGAMEAGAECEEVLLSKMKMNNCLSCGRCNEKDHFLKCVWEEKDDVKSIFDKIIAADLIIYATPIYIFTLPALLKTFLDRSYSTGDVFDLKMTKSGMFFHHINPDLSSKPFVPLICCDNIEKATPANAISFFKTFSKFQDAPMVGLLLRNAGGFIGHGKRPEMLEMFPKIADSLEAFEQAGRELATTGRISRATQKRASQYVLPFPPIKRFLNQFRPFKRKMIEQARIMRQAGYTEGDI